MVGRRRAYHASLHSAGIVSCTSLSFLMRGFRRKVIERILMERSSRIHLEVMGIEGLQLPILHKGLQLWAFLKMSLTWKEYNRRNTGSNPLYPSSYKHPIITLLPAP